jgi:hypothetical protein
MVLIESASSGATFSTPCASSFRLSSISPLRHACPCARGHAAAQDYAP